MGRFWSLGEVMLGAIFSTVMFVPLVFVTVGGGLAAGSAIHGGEMFFPWYFFAIVAPFVLFVAVMHHWWMIIFWPAVLIPAYRGFYSESIGARLIILAILFVDGLLMGLLLS